MTRMNRCHRYSDGQPFSARAYTRDVFDTAHILHFDYAVGQRLARTARASDSDSDSDSDSSATEHVSPGATQPAGSGNSASNDHSDHDGDRGDDHARGSHGSSGDDGDGGDGNNDEVTATMMIMMMRIAAAWRWPDDEGSGGDGDGGDGSNDDDDDDDDDGDDDGDHDDGDDDHDHGFRTLTVGDQIHIAIKRVPLTATVVQLHPEDRTVTVSYRWGKGNKLYHDRLFEEQLGFFVTNFDNANAQDTVPDTAAGSDSEDLCRAAP